jgi:surfeit locus 1 family protein
MFGLLAAAAMVGFGLLGRWQWHRAEQKRVVQQAFAAGMAAGPVAMDARPLAAWPRYAHLELRGQYDGAHQFLLDNISRDGHAGYEVLTPFRLDDGRTVMVNRGWLPQPGGSRDQLPVLTLEAPASAVVTITARADELPVSGIASGHAAPTVGIDWPKLTSFPLTAELAAALQQPIEARQLLLDANQRDGYRRDWQPASASFGPERHLSYAIQWWSLGLLVLVIYVYMMLRKTGD